MQGTTGRVIVGVLWLVILVVLGGAWGASAAKSRHQPAASRTKAISQGSEQAAPAPLRRSSAESAVPSSERPQLDLFGNVIERAVSDYRIDFEGGTYEAHSPETAITRLSAPSL